ncbi:RNase adapter RapZ [Sphingomonas sp. S-NIH.Pt15_0812]|uniref:RNase adapter RapZ n=1 Tax=Sphingomonas sp. S-NIH.Pt15_0812 TaxID=1920129 RepID=UPI000F7E0B5B|nr:RNase adapter RapZ [Sphingomonas sp. S-NIH.Pt15_0812]RSU45954.1 RNase adapter RapZ [Sphingomonas sp. S-NIH.Pt15_0812]
MTADILFVTGLSGAGKSTVLKTLEDLGWEVVDNLPLVLLDRLLEAPAPPTGSGGRVQPLAVGIGARTRDFDAKRVVEGVERLQRQHGAQVELLFLDCTGAELERRYAETRHRHPLALDRPAGDGIARERELLAPLRAAAGRLIDTSTLNSSELAAQIRTGFTGPATEPVLTVTSFGFARGLPRNADLVFDMRFLRNPHWVPALKPGTGLDADVAAYVADDPCYEPAVSRIEDLLALLVPRYRAEGKSYVTVAIGCTGGRHRSVHVAERIGRFLHDRGFSPTVTHRDLGTRPQDPLEGLPTSPA